MTLVAVVLLTDITDSSWKLPARISEARSTWSSARRCMSSLSPNLNNAHHSVYLQGGGACARRMSAHVLHLWFQAKRGQFALFSLIRSLPLRHIVLYWQLALRSTSWARDLPTNPCTWHTSTGSIQCESRVHQHLAEAHNVHILCLRLHTSTKSTNDDVHSYWQRCLFSESWTQ